MNFSGPDEVELSECLKSRTLSEGKALYALCSVLGVDKITATAAVEYGCFKTESEFARGAQSLARNGFAKEGRYFHGVELK